MSRPTEAATKIKGSNAPPDQLLDLLVDRRLFSFLNVEDRIESVQGATQDLAAARRKIFAVHGHVGFANDGSLDYDLTETCWCIYAWPAAHNQSGNRTFFVNTQWFIQYIDGWEKGMTTDGPWSIFGVFAAATGYFQDRLLSQLTFVHDLRSESGGVIFDLTWRFTSNFSVAVGMATFYGSPQRADDPTLYPTSITNNGPPYSHNSRYDGLSLLRDRDEASIRIRYTF